jgi:hypothetical protein
MIELTTLHIVFQYMSISIVYKIYQKLRQNTNRRTDFLSVFRVLGILQPIVTNPYAADSVCRWLIEVTSHCRSMKELINAQIAGKPGIAKIFIIDKNTLSAKNISAVTNITGTNIFFIFL